jgi:hypothetical protein
MQLIRHEQGKNNWLRNVTIILRRTTTVHLITYEVQMQAKLQCNTSESIKNRTANRTANTEPDLQNGSGACNPLEFVDLPWLGSH